jgi:radical SAM superfamily enzyme YgiQ (UPF0313 family)
MKALLVQPPLVQLNTPYPAIYYLEAFLRRRGIDARARDHSIETYRRLFRRAFLPRVFEAARAALPRARGQERSELERYLSYEELYLEWIDGISDFLSGGDPAFAHRLAQAVELPRGVRASAFLEARSGRISPDEARGLATAVLADLGDLVSYAYDPSFSTVRYAERFASGLASFADAAAALDRSPVLSDVYAPLLEREWAALGGAPDLLLVSIPFPGCLLGALACARSARSAFGGRTLVIFGGGYVSTELRNLRDGGLFDYCDYLSFDAGYGSLASILEVAGGAPRSRLYRTRYRAEDGSAAAAGLPDVEGAAPCDAADRLAREELEALRSIAPDYAAADFSRYLRVLDSANPMHRLWSDSPWLKYRLAQGCYWRRCRFCDTELDYVRSFARADVGELIAAAGKAADRAGLRGIHFVDEAMPMPALLEFAAANRARAAAGEAPFHFWGNVRFDSSWTADRCEYLAAAGLVAVSGGIEIATEGGLEMTDKGFDLAGLVGTLVAMRRAGLLVHAYLIYGFPGQDRAEVVDSAEVCRQLFASGLVDSAFWHRFVLTRHSRMYREWKDGARPGLQPIDERRAFADNDLRFAGEEAFDEFDGPLAAVLDRWMEGEGLDEAAGASLERAGLRGAARRRAVDPGLVESLIAQAEAALDAAADEAGRETAGRGAEPGRAHWIAGLPLAGGGAGRGEAAASLAWTYRGEARSVALPAGRAEAVAAALLELARAPDGLPFGELASRLGLPRDVLGRLRSSGLVIV